MLALSAKAAKDALVTAYLPNFDSVSRTVRFHVGIYQIDARRADAAIAKTAGSCYDGERACQFVTAKNGGPVRSDLGVVTVGSAVHARSPPRVRRWCRRRPAAHLWCTPGSFIQFLSKVCAYSPVTM